MTAITPELLMRYADGEVNLPERQFVEERLSADREAQELLAVFLAQRGCVAAAFSRADDAQAWAASNARLISPWSSAVAASVKPNVVVGFCLWPPPF